MQPQEIELRKAICYARHELAAAYERRDYVEYLKLLSTLAPKINAFLDNVRIL